MTKSVKRFRFCEDCFECFTLATPTDAICDESEVWTEFTRYERIVSTVTSRAGIAACRAALKEAANA